MHRMRRVTSSTVVVSGPSSEFGSNVALQRQMGHEADRGTFPARSSPSVMGGFGGRRYRRCCTVLGQ